MLFEVVDVLMLECVLIIEIAFQEHTNVYNICSYITVLCIYSAVVAKRLPFPLSKLPFKNTHVPTIYIHVLQNYATAI